MGKVTVNFFGALVKITGEKTSTVEALTLQDTINALTAKYGEPFKNRLYDNKGNLTRFVNIYVNGKDVRFLGGLSAQLTDKDVVSFIPAVGGG
jgi:MoaD family protein